MESTKNKNNNQMFLCELKELRNENSALKKRIEILERENHSLKSQLNNLDDNTAVGSTVKRKKTEKDQVHKEETESKSCTLSGKTKAKTYNHTLYSKKQRLIQSYIPSPCPDLPAIFESLNDDTKGLILQFVGNKSYATYAGINKHCKEIYLITSGMEKKTFIYGYAPLSVITSKIERGGPFYWEMQKSVGKGIVFYNRKDVLDWALQQKENGVLREIIILSLGEGRFDLLDEVYNKVEEWKDKIYIFENSYEYAARHGKLDVVKWLESHGFPLSKYSCASGACHGGYLFILQWLREQRGMELKENLYNYAIYGKNFSRIGEWLREQGCPWFEYSFVYAAQVGELDILQWLHDKGCPWPRTYDNDNFVHESDIDPETRDWLIVNGYRNKIERG